MKGGSNLTDLVIGSWGYILSVSRLWDQRVFQNNSMDTASTP